MSSYTKEKKRPGRPPLDNKIATAQLAFKCPVTYKAKVGKAVKALGKLGHETNESEILRLVVGDNIESLKEIYLKYRSDGR